MKKYIYEAYSQFKGKIIGEIDADDKNDLRKKLKIENLILIKADIKKENKIFSKLKKISNKELIELTYQLSIMLESGISIKKSLEIQKDLIQKKNTKDLVESILRGISQGRSFKDGIKENENIFKPIYINVVAMGEISGNLHSSLKELSLRLEKNEKMKKEIKKILIYPTLVFITTLFLILFLLIFILPKFVENFQQNLEKLPKLTRKMLLVSENIKNYFLEIFFIIISLFFFIKKIKFFKNQKTNLSYILLKLPLIKEIYSNYHILKILRAIYILLKSGISILKTLDLIIKEESNTLLKNEIIEIKNSLKIGSSLEESLKNSLFFDALTLTLISIGEKSGNLLEMLQKNIDFLENKLNENLRYFMTLLEPILIIILGIMLGGVLIGIYLPIFDIESYLG
ncbi:MAG: type II secretion system F family protein [Fusobacteriaceae bacterium]